jgi:hypothetical protein
MRVTMRTAVVLIIAFNVVSSCILPTTAYFIESDWVTEINDAALEIDIDTTAEIVVFLVPSLIGHGIKDKQGNEINDIVELGVYIFNEGDLETFDGSQVGIGKPGKDNGVLVLIAVEERQWRIEVGYGLEGDITDVESNRIAQDYLVPLFEQGNYGEGLYYTVVALGNEIPSVNSNADSPVRGYYVYEVESAYVPEPWWATSYYGLPLWVIILLALLGIFVPIAGSKRGRGGRSGGGGSTGRW